RSDQHIKVEELGAAGLIRATDDALHNQELAFFGYSAAAVRQDCLILIVCPVVKDVLQNIEVAPARDSFKKITVNQLAASRDLRVQLGSGRGDHVLQVEQDASHLAVSPQNSRQKDTFSSTDIHNVARLREIIR